MVEGMKKVAGVSFIRSIVSVMRALPSQSNHLPKVPPPDTIILGIRFQHRDLWGTHSVHSRSLFLDYQVIFMMFYQENSIIIPTPQVKKQAQVCQHV